MITGAAGALGEAVARGFFARGDRLALFDRDGEKLQRLQASLGDAARVGVYITDLLDPASLATSLAAVHANLGRVGVLANIAGGFAMGPRLHETSDADWNLMLDLNLRSVFHCCRVAIPDMLALGGGQIVSVSARAAREGKAGMGPYCASKAAVITLTEALAAEHKQDGIRVNCILPGTIDTPRNRLDMPDADFSRWVPPEALADVILFLASDAARAVTGAAIPVYGRS
jgi:NAD(P)-dependent dehydrogenase (short-subunit alcohol dehydrogenase family)